MLVVSLGVDTYEADPISHFRLASSDYTTIGADIADARQVAREELLGERLDLVAMHRRRAEQVGLAPIHGVIDPRRRQADAAPDAAIAAVNTGAIYKYITKPWEPPQLEQTLLTYWPHWKHRSKR